MMEIKLNISKEMLSSMLEANDPNREIWGGIDDLTQQDVCNMVSSILRTWYYEYA